MKKIVICFLSYFLFFGANAQTTVNFSCLSGQKSNWTQSIIFGISAPEMEVESGINFDSTRIVWVDSVMFQKIIQLQKDYLVNTSHEKIIQKTKNLQLPFFSKHVIYNHNQKQKNDLSIYFEIPNLKKINLINCTKEQKKFLNYTRKAFFSSRKSLLKTGGVLLLFKDEEKTPFFEYSFWIQS